MQSEKINGMTADGLFADELAEVREALVGDKTVHHLTADSLVIRSPGVGTDQPGRPLDLNGTMRNAGVNRKGRRAYLAAHKAGAKHR